MKVITNEIEGLLVVEPKVFGDSRGFFLESWNKLKFDEATGMEVSFVQDNHSKSESGTLRGLHIQTKNAQGKLVRVVKGAVYDVAVDLRKDSKTYGKWFGLILSAENKKQLWIPKGFAHGFLALEDDTEILYKCDGYYDPLYEVSIDWNDKALAIDWGQFESFKTLKLSDKDSKGIGLSEFSTLEKEF
ncbi:dTDP-4-dehydrorhamnose 3,5-epimerase [Vibrio parahaemolyticus]|uniref:dTDP-4-dehydrorhamnose 3,5-epimerase n=1 Tax=Vibrio parahaemolyticus TaxID=670 RepID=UPI0009379FC6|nr:dTDP-4-dehydrorhamnose 3,5-epimerase [Vibrio parahaemolyticus]OKA70449.1 dTDP-4-dehydrorhamnose 3,5-epimerase [Vibrio parahaemolyticus]